MVASMDVEATMVGNQVWRDQTFKPTLKEPEKFVCSTKKERSKERKGSGVHSHPRATNHGW